MIGLLAAIAIAVAVWGYKYIKGKNLLSSSRFFYVEYKDVSGLSESAPVRVNGMHIGIVSNLSFKPDDMNVIVAELEINNRQIRIPKSTVAKVVSDGVMGGRFIELEFKGNCGGPDCAQSGDYFQGSTLGFFESLTGLGKQDLETSFVQLKSVGNDLLDTLQSPNSEVGKALEQFNIVLDNLKKSTTRFDRLLAASSGDLQSSFSDLSAMSRSLKANTQNFEDIIHSTKSLMKEASSLDLDKTVSKTNYTIDQAGAAAQKLQSSLDSLDGAIVEIKSFVETLNNSNGTLGKLISEDTLYQNITKSLEQVAKLSKDIEEHPYRYIPFKSKRKVDKYDRELSAEGKR